MISGLLYADSYHINDHISIVVPKVGDIIDNEDAYYSVVTAVTATPYNFMVQLDDVGIDFTSINSFELFLMLFRGLQESDTHLVFGDLDLSKFKLSVNMKNETVVLVDPESGIVIDRTVHDMISRVLREINNIERKDKYPGNEAAKKYMIERARVKQNRARSKKKSQLEDLIVAMVNTKEYKYDFESTRDLTIYQFNRSVRQVVKKINYDNTMIGCYAGTVNIEKISQDELNWLSSK